MTSISRGDQNELSPAFAFSGCRGIFQDSIQLTGEDTKWTPLRHKKCHHNHATIPTFSGKDDFRYGRLRENGWKGQNFALNSLLTLPVNFTIHNESQLNDRGLHVFSINWNESYLFSIT